MHQKRLFPRTGVLSILLDLWFVPGRRDRLILCLLRGVPYSRAYIFLHHAEFLRIKYALLLINTQKGMNQRLVVATIRIWISLNLL